MGLERELRAAAIGRVETVAAAPRGPGSGEVRVSVRRCGICGSDLHFFTGRQPLPAVCPGHEISGVVAAVGADVDGWSPGQRVAVEPLVRCGHCPRCRRGDYHLCRQLRIAGVAVPGGMADSLVVPDYTLFRLPDAVDFELGALAEPMAVVVHALRLAGTVEGTSVLVLGAGSIGLLAAAAARHLGAGSVAITARHEHQRAAARRLGCDRVLDPDDVQKVEPRPCVVIETVGGSAATVPDAIRTVDRGGTIVIIGIFDAPLRIDSQALLVKEIRLVGSMVYNRTGGKADFDTALEILAAHASELRPLVTHVFALEEAQVGFETAADKKTGAIKVMLAPTS